MSLSKYNETIDWNYLQKHSEDSSYDRKSAKVDNKLLANTISSFANANGGLISVGIEDDGTITGFENVSENKYRQFLKILSNTYFKSIPNCKIETIYVKNKNNNDDKILLFHIAPSTNKVIRNSKDEVYLRQADSSNKLDSDQIKILEYERNEMDFEDEIVKRATLDDIDEEMVQMYRERLN